MIVSSTLYKYICPKCKENMVVPIPMEDDTISKKDDMQFLCPKCGINMVKKDLTFIDKLKYKFYKK
jgi:predicted RNA-binding Zn-ribbon protein involved in translation (DUF1610 family)